MKAQRKTGNKEIIRLNQRNILIFSLKLTSSLNTKIKIAIFLQSFSCITLKLIDILISIFFFDLLNQ